MFHFFFFFLFSFFRSKMAVFGAFTCKNCTNWATVGAIRINKIELWFLDYLSEKWLDNICHGLEEMNFSRKSVAEFLTLHHLSSRCDILATITPNRVRLEPMETIHSKLSKDIKFEEIRDCKGLQTVARKSDKKPKKEKEKKKKTK